MYGVRSGRAARAPASRSSFLHKCRLRKFPAAAATIPNRTTLGLPEAWGSAPAGWIQGLRGDRGFGVSAVTLGVECEIEYRKELLRDAGNLERPLCIGTRVRAISYALSCVGVKSGSCCQKRVPVSGCHDFSRAGALHHVSGKIAFWGSYQKCSPCA